MMLLASAAALPLSTHPWQYPLAFDPNPRTLDKSVIGVVPAASTVCEAQYNVVYWADDATFQNYSCGLTCGTFMDTSSTSCVQISEDGGEAVQTFKVGPLTSTGGYDWWQLSGAISLYTFNTSATTISVAGFSVTFHDNATGELLGIPPILDHHTAFVIYLPDTNQYLPIGLGAGDGQCHDEVKGWPCLYHDWTELGASFPMWTALGLDMIARDVRPADSEPLTWYMNISVTLIKDPVVRDLKPIMKLFLRTAAKADTKFATLDVSTEEDSFTITTGQFPTGGVFIAGELPGQGELSNYHSHQELFHHAFIFAGAPEELGLADPSFKSWSGCDPVTTASAGFASNDEMLAHLESTSPQSFSLNVPAAQKAKLLCKTHAGQVQVGELWWERRSTWECLDDTFNITAGQAFTTLSFFGPKPNMPFMESLPQTTEGFAIEHNDWSFYYFPDDTSDKNLTVVYVPMISVGAYNETRCQAADLNYLSQELFSAP